MFILFFLMLVVVPYSPFRCGSSAYQIHSLGFEVALPFVQSYQNYKTLISLALERFKHSILLASGLPSKVKIKVKQNFKASQFNYEK